MPRVRVVGVDGRGLAIVSPLDGTNKVESDNAAIEKTLSASSYSLKNGHALLLASATRISVHGMEAAGHWPSSLGHVDLQLARARNEVCHRRGLPPPHPHIGAWSTDTGARFAVDYFEQQMARTNGTTIPHTEVIEPPSVDSWLAPLCLTQAEEDGMNAAAAAGPAVLAPSVQLANTDEEQQQLIKLRQLARDWDVPHDIINKLTGDRSGATWLSNNVSGGMKFCVAGSAHS